MIATIIQDIVADYHDSHFDLVEELKTLEGGVLLLFRSFITGSLIEVEVDGQGRYWPL